MSRMKEEAEDHTVKIQQTYWVKETSEGKLVAQGAVRQGRALEHVDYYDTELYELALQEMWLSRTGQYWQLIVGKRSSQQAHKPGPEGGHKAAQKANQFKASNSKTSKEEDSKILQNKMKNTVEEEESRRKALACYALEQERAIITYLSPVLHVTAETDDEAMGDFLQRAGIQKYASITNVTQETFRLGGGYTVVLKTEGTTTKKTATVSLDVDIEDVVRGFQRLEHLASDLDFQLQNV